jgi:hypothetical protein
MASPTEDTVGVIAVEIQDAQTAKEAFRSDAVADSFGDVDATYTVSTIDDESSRCL